ncbi:MAG: hypothetical protein FD147_1081 [Chloroflexi bacterium]|nr:MAG: hypothetical protein FD147_1081 [Chloroflexota bacterium]
MWEQVHRGDRVEIWTLFSGDSPSENLTTYAGTLHTRWGVNKNPYAARRTEDIAACKLLLVSYRHLNYHDCIYRRLPETGEPLIKEDPDLFFEIHPGEEYLVKKIKHDLASRLAKDATIISPLGVGGHMDHRITRAVAEELEIQIWYYPDFPYSALPENPIEALLPLYVTPVAMNVSLAGKEAWWDAIACYRSQLSSFWQSVEEMKEKVQAYADSPLACTLWQKTQP